MQLSDHPTAQVLAYTSSYFHRLTLTERLNANFGANIVILYASICKVSVQRLMLTMGSNIDGFRNMNIYFADYVNGPNNVIGYVIGFSLPVTF